LTLPTDGRDQPSPQFHELARAFSDIGRELVKVGEALVVALRDG
jgi:hypothetical protein